MQFTKKHKVAAVLGASAVAVAGGGVAFAYFTSVGAGSATGAVGTAGRWDVSTTTAAATGYASGMQPGVAASDETVTVTIKNLGRGYQQLNGFTVDVGKSDGTGPWTSATPAPFPSESLCGPGDFALGSNTAAGQYKVTGLAQDLAPGATYVTTVNLHMLDTGVAQDNCDTTQPQLFIFAS